MPVATGILGDAERRAVLTLLDMPAQASGPAHLDRTHDPTFDTPEMSVVCLTISFPVVAKNVRHLQSRRHGDLAQPGGTTSSVSRSSGLVVLRIRVLETFV